jgi:hypothetical protein
MCVLALQAASSCRPSVPEAMQQPVSWDVFISHAGRDADKLFALKLQNLLNDAGIVLRVSLDLASLRVGEHSGPQVAEAMKSSRVGLLLLSREFFERPAPQAELAVLLERKDAQHIQLLPVFLSMTIEECTAELEAAFPGGLCGACSDDACRD